MRFGIVHVLFVICSFLMEMDFSLRFAIFQSNKGIGNHVYTSPAQCGSLMTEGDDTIFFLPPHAIDFKFVIFITQPFFTEIAP